MHHGKNEATGCIVQLCYFIYQETAVKDYLVGIHLKIKEETF